MNFNNYISFTIYGDIYKYIELLKINVAFLKKKNFSTIIYCDNENLSLICSIFSDSLVLDGNMFGVKNKMLWRLNPIFDNFSNSFFPRDADSLITEREIELMNLFLKSNRSFHIIRDHELHYMPIMGGLFGVKNELYHVFFADNLINKLFNVKEGYNLDQLFLADCIYPKIINEALVHTSSYHYVNEPFLKIEKVDNYCGKYVNDSLSKFDLIQGYSNIKNRRPLHYLIARAFRYKWFFFLKK
jgi:hypothetical protein